MRSLQRTALALAVCLNLILVVSAQAGPADVELITYPGESISFTMETMSSGAPVVDLVLLQDETMNFRFAIQYLQSGLADQLVAALEATGWDYATGVAGFRDFGRWPWGNSGDHVYRRHADLSPGGGGLLAGVGSLWGWGGGDGWGEAQLEALHYLANTGHAGIDSNGDNRVVDPNDTPAGQQPNWRANATKVVLLATDGAFHQNGDCWYNNCTYYPPQYYPTWPGDSDTVGAVATASNLSSAGITVIALTPDGADPGGYLSTLAAGTGGSVQAMGTNGAQMVDAVMTGLSELGLRTDVWWGASCDPGLSVNLAPPAQYGIPLGTSASFEATVNVANPTDPGDYTCSVTFYGGGYPSEGAVIDQQSIHVEVIPIPIGIDIKPGGINLGGNGMVPVAILGSAELDIANVDLSTLGFGPGGVGPAHDLTDVTTYWNHVQDVNGDGYMDLLCHFRQEGAGLQPGDTEACLTGDFVDERAFEGCDPVKVRGH